MFSNEKFTFSSSAQLFEKVNISHNISNFFSPKLAFLHKNDVEKNTRHFTPKIARHDFITGGAKYFICWKIVTLIQKYHFIDILDKSVIFLVKFTFQVV